MIKAAMTSLFLISSMTLFAWQDHPDNDDSRRDEQGSSCNYVETDYDWSTRDQEPNESNCCDTIERGTYLAPDRDK